MEQTIKNIIKDPFSADNLSQKELEEIIKYAADKFFNTNKPVLEDNIYDILIDFLKNKFPKSKTLKEIGSKIKSKDKVKLDYWLGSMDKIKPDKINELEKWLNKYKGNYLLSDKLDGISALLVYYNNGNINLYTRGTASEGLDITPLLKYLKIPKISEEILKKNNIIAKKKDVLLAVRGELILKKNIFETNWSKIMKNARNTVAGLVNSKNINPKLAMDTTFIVYEIIDPIIIPEEQLLTSKKLGFETVNYKIVNTLTFNSLSEYLKKRRSDSEYIIDGIIVTNNQLYTRNIKSNPEYSFAFKDVLEDQIAKTKITDIEWNISKDGLIKPTLLLEPVEIGGVEICRVTGHNARNIVDKKLGKGAIIELIRSGDVIPHIQNVLKPASSIKLPEGKWSWNETNIDIVSNDINNKDMLIKNIYYFFSKLDTKGLGEKIVEKLVNSGLDSVKKIIECKDFTMVEGIKEKLSNNLVESINKALQNIKLSKFMAATNKLGPGLGEERIKQIIDNYPNILKDYKKWSNEEFITKLKELNNWEEKTSSLFVSNFNDFINFYNEIKDYIKFETNSKVTTTIKNKYTGLTIVLSGFRDKELQKFLEDSGAKISETISSKTDLLIVKDQETIDKETGKVSKAKNLNINIITKNAIKI
jgi:NAD-dependent DNA ligase